jgi:HK97 family phage prohead protease
MMALCGYVTYWNKIIAHHGNTVMVLPGCFDRTLRSGVKVEFLLNHQPELLVGSNRDGCLQLHSDHIGLAMRATLPTTERGKTARWMGINGHTAASIGFDWHGAKKQTRCINGVDVICVLDADLYEVSYLFGRGLGAVKESYITYKDVDFSESLRDQCSNHRFQYEGAAVHFSRALEQYESEIAD